MDTTAFRNNFELQRAKTSITREDFEKHFIKTKDKIRFTFAGWDGKSYNGESRTATIYRTDIEGYEDIRFVKVGKSIHYIIEDSAVLERATGESHPKTNWVVDVLRA